MSFFFSYISNNFEIKLWTLIFYFFNSPTTFGALPLGKLDFLTAFFTCLLPASTPVYYSNFISSYSSYLSFFLYVTTSSYLYLL